MTRFMGDPTKHFKTLAELVEIFAQRQESVAEEGDESKDLRVLRFEAAMMAGEWPSAVVFTRDGTGLIADGIHRGIAYLRCLDAGADTLTLPELLLAPLGSYRWPVGLKERIEAEQGQQDDLPPR